MIWLGFLLAAVIMFAMARAFRAGVRQAAHPTFVLEEPPLPRDLAAVVKRLARWKVEGRLDPAVMDRLLELVRQDAGKSDKP